MNEGENHRFRTVGAINPGAPKFIKLCGTLLPTGEVKTTVDTNNLTPEQEMKLVCGLLSQMAEVLGKRLIGITGQEQVSNISNIPPSIVTGQKSVVVLATLNEMGTCHVQGQIQNCTPEQHAKILFNQIRHLCDVTAETLDCIKGDTNYSVFPGGSI